MGVLSIGITWDLPDNKFKKHFHQFFYIDVEDYGLERYDSILGEEDDKYYDIQRTYVGGLGARLVEISLREAMWLLQKYSNRALKNGYKIPTPVDEYIDLLRPTVIFTDPEMYILDSKQCAPVSTPYEDVYKRQSKPSLRPLPTPKYTSSKAGSSCNRCLSKNSCSEPGRYASALRPLP